VVLLTPLFSTATHLGLYNTYYAVILPLAALQVPFAVLLTRNFVNGIPDDLFDAARVDGANAAVIFWRIILPLTRPIAAAIVILTLIGAWNDYLLPLVFLQTPGTETITLLPTFFVSEFSDDQTKVVASAVFTVSPKPPFTVEAKPTAAVPVLTVVSEPSSTALLNCTASLEVPIVPLSVVAPPALLVRPPL